MQYGKLNREDPFSNVKGLIQDVINQLEAEAQAEAGEKAYCDEQLSVTKTKKKRVGRQYFQAIRENGSGDIKTSKVEGTGAGTWK